MARTRKHPCVTSPEPVTAATNADAATPDPSDTEAEENTLALADAPPEEATPSPTDAAPEAAPPTPTLADAAPETTTPDPAGAATTDADAPPTEADAAPTEADPAPADADEDIPDEEKRRRRFRAAAVLIRPRCPRCGKSDFRHLSRRDHGEGYDYHKPGAGYIGRMTGTIRAVCKTPGCETPVVIKEVVPAASLADCGSESPKVEPPKAAGS